MTEADDDHTGPGETVQSLRAVQRGEAVSRSSPLSALCHGPGPKLWVLAWALLSLTLSQFGDKPLPTVHLG